jgi:hypothetical protein
MNEGKFIKGTEQVQEHPIEDVIINRCNCATKTDD